MFDIICNFLKPRLAVSVNCARHIMGTKLEVPPGYVNLINNRWFYRKPIVRRSISIHIIFLPWVVKYIFKKKKKNARFKSEVLLMLWSSMMAFHFPRQNMSIVDENRHDWNNEQLHEKTQWSMTMWFCTWQLRNWSIKVWGYSSGSCCPSVLLLSQVLWIYY